MWNENVCRLCLSKKELVCVFESRENEVDNLKQIVFVTTGVEIVENDVISRKICEHCRKVTLKIKEFKEKSLEADKYLKEKYSIYLKRLNGKTPQIEDLTIDEVIEVETNSKMIKTKKKNIHPTISNIRKSYPNIELPKEVLHLDVNPQVCMELDAVENHFKAKKLNMIKTAEEVLNSFKKIKKTEEKILINDKNSLKRKLEDLEVTESDTKSEEKPQQNTHKCKVCGTIESSLKKLKKHIGQHFRCKFCKNKFRLLSRKEEHEETCYVKSALTNNISVVLQRLNIEDFNKKNIESNENDEKSNILIIDENEQSSSLDSNNLIIDNSTNETMKLSDEKCEKNIDSALIRPELRIDNDEIFKSIDFTTNDMLLLKHLVKNQSKESQKDNIPTDITSGGNGVTYFKDLKNHCYSFKIPVNIENGVFNVKYVKNDPTPTVKYNHLWSNLPPIRLNNKLLNLKNNKETLNVNKPSNSGTHHIIQNINQNSVNAKTKPFILNQMFVRFDENKHQTPNNSRIYSYNQPKKYILQTNVPQTSTNTNNIENSNTITSNDNREYILTTINTGNKQQQVYIPNTVPINKPTTSTDLFQSTINNAKVVGNGMKIVRTYGKSLTNNSSVPTTNSAQSVNNTEQFVRPVIRVRNICELK